MTIIRRDHRLTGPKGQFEDELKEIQLLRDNLAHANDYAASPQAATRTCETVRLMDKWSKEFLQWPPT
jgi:hypothetical protein